MIDPPPSFKFAVPSKLGVGIILLLSGILMPLPALANLGETFEQIKAHYGQPVTNISAFTDPGDKAVSTYAYNFNGQIMFVAFIDGKSSSEVVPARTNNLHYSEKEAVALAKQISGENNWAEMSRSGKEIRWIAGDKEVSLQPSPTPGRPDMVIVMATKYIAHEILVKATLNWQEQPAKRTQSE